MVAGADSPCRGGNERGICKGQLGPVGGGVLRGRRRHLDSFPWVFGAVKLREESKRSPTLVPQLLH